nr:DNA translocase FtsK [Anaplasma marginale]
MGYNRAANLVERMEREGVITSGQLGKREIVE